MVVCEKKMYRKEGGREKKGEREIQYNYEKNA